MNGNRPPDYGADEPSGILSRTPEKLWPDRIVFHGARFGLVGLIALLLALLFPPVPQASVTQYDVGGVALEQILARVAFTVPKTQSELARDQEDAEAGVVPVFELLPDAAITTEDRLGTFFDLVSTAVRQGGVETLKEALTAENIMLSDPQLEILADSVLVRELRTASLTAVRQYLLDGVMDSSDRNELTTDRIWIHRGDDTEISVSIMDIVTNVDFYEAAIDELEREDTQLSDVLGIILIRFVDPSLQPSIQRNAQRYSDARDAVSHTKGALYSVDAEVLGANIAITAVEVERLNAYNQALAASGMLTPTARSRVALLGAAVVNFLLMLSYGLLLFFFRVEVYRNFRWLLIQAIVIAAYVGAAFVIDRQAFPTELLPVAFVVLTVAVLWDGRMALVLGLVLAILTGIQPPFASGGGLSGSALVATIAVGASAAALTTRAFRRRAQMWYFIAVVSGAYAALLVGMGLANETPVTAILQSVGAATGNAFVSGILALGLVSFFEWFTGITTDQTLLEWTDPNRPLLKRLSMEAPGTYAHTINVANFAEAAANAIGANGLLCRVGIYYHDVGKMLKPQYFVENQSGMNPHDRLKPETSAEIVREHVTEGIRLAREAKIPAVIRAFIPEHHGTQTISFFYDKAREENPDAELDPTRFTYPGPRPRSKETAIAMLADSIESATRVLQDPTAERIRSLVEELVASKLADGQLDDSSLTLTDLALLREQFIKMLGSMFHQRIDYPQTRHLTEAPGRDEEAEAVSSALPGTEIEKDEVVRQQSDQQPRSVITGGDTDGGGASSAEEAVSGREHSADKLLDSP